MKLDTDIIASFTKKATEIIFYEYAKYSISKHLIEIVITPEIFGIDKEIFDEMIEDEFWFDYYDRRFYVRKINDKYTLFGIKKIEAYK